MSIRFAASKPSVRARTRPSSTSLSFPRAANDNGDNGLGDTKLTEALRHFAQHGLSAAQEAYDEARAAFAAGDEQEFERSRDICRALDRRLAQRLPLRQEIANQR